MTYLRKRLEAKKTMERKKKHVKRAKDNTYEMGVSGAKVSYHQLRAQCLKKASYSSFKMALGVKRRAQEFRGTPMRIYECPNCGLYHLTKRNPV